MTRKGIEPRDGKRARGGAAAADTEADGVTLSGSDVQYYELDTANAVPTQAEMSFTLTVTPAPDVDGLPKTGDESLPAGFLLLAMVVSLGGLSRTARRKHN